jgi:hypothetical protein
MGRANPVHFGSQFDKLDELDLCVEVINGCHYSVEGTSPFPFAPADKLDDLNRLRRVGISHPGNPTDRAQSHAFKNKVVNAAHDREAVTCRVNDIGDPARVVSFLFDRDNRLLISELVKDGGRDVDTIGRRIVLDEYFEVRGTSN